MGGPQWHGFSPQPLHDKLDRIIEMLEADKASLILVPCDDDDSDFTEVEKAHEESSILEALENYLQHKLLSLPLEQRSTPEGNAYTLVLAELAVLRGRYGV